MQTSYKHLSVIIGFGLLLTLLGINLWVTLHQFGIQMGNQTWVAHTERVLLELSETELLFQEAEAGQRGYLYTGDPKYLLPYQRATTQIESHVDTLAQLTADNPVEQARIPVLRNLAKQKDSELAQTISLYQSGKSADAKALVLSDRGLFLMNDIRNVMEQMTQEETSLDAARTGAYKSSIHVTVICIYLASFLAAFGLILLADYILREMRLRERHARQIGERDAWFRVTLNSMGDAVIATDEQGLVTFVNPIAESLLGRGIDETRGKAVENVFPIFNESTHQRVENPVKKVMALGHVVGLANHTVLQRADGTLIPIEDSAAPIRDDLNRLIGVVLVFRDATAGREMEEVMRKSEKLAAAARIAATVAHEINNPLEAVGNLIYIARGVPNLPLEADEQLAIAEQELERVSHLARQTLGFYRESRIPDQVELPGLIDSVLKMYSNKFRTKNIKISRDFGECPPVRGLAGELKQVVANLVSNAADAVSVDGMIQVKLSCAEDSGCKVARISVIDDGPGVATADREKIFEPFFTTKKDVGTGLGLWVAKEILERHGGSIQVHSANGNPSPGSVFEVILPLNVQDSPQAA